MNAELRLIERVQDNDCQRGVEEGKQREGDHQASPGIASHNASLRVGLVFG